MINNFLKISHNIPKGLTYFILLARNPVFVQFLFLKKVEWFRICFKLVSLTLAQACR